MILKRILASVVRTFTTAWGLMLLAGVLHHEVSTQIKPLGYWPSVAITFLALWVVSAFAIDAAADIRTDVEAEER